MSILSAWIFILSISLTIAVQLDGICTDTTQCDGTEIMHCEDGKCQCDTPWYKPCKTSCDVNLGVAYQGGECRVDGNCIGNTFCRNRKCECMVDFTEKNGVCFKNLKLSCTIDAECWSGYCSNTQCSCLPGYEPLGDSPSCQRKLVNIYNNWNEANLTTAFCIDQNSCIDFLAECYTDPAHNTTKFCKCPTGYKHIENKRCEAIKSEGLSPFNMVLASYGECGYCEDNNAACITAGQEKTCWCRSGYVKNNNQCEKRTMKSLIIFPNEEDVLLHDFTNGCANQTQNKLCVCSPGYEFKGKDLPCAKIQQKSFNNVEEYGVCTIINSRDEAIPEDGLCSEPLKCIAKIDKHVCSCGKDKFLDIDDPTQCIYFIGSTTNLNDNQCPKNASLNPTTQICECNSGYKAVHENRQCEMILSSEMTQLSCNLNSTIDPECQKLFGNTAFFCTIGECRCSGDESYPNNDKTHCYAPVNKTLVSSTVECPSYSTRKVSSCECDNGYRPSADFRRCDSMKADLIDYAGASTNTDGGLTTPYCQLLYSGPVEAYGTHCQCQSNAFINDAKNGCWYILDVGLLLPTDTDFCPPYSTTGGIQQCRCEEGYINDKDNRKCDQITKQVFFDKDPAAPNVTAITQNTCVKLFGVGAEKSTNGGYCICRSDAYSNDAKTYCLFLINIISPPIKSLDNCPPYTIFSSETSPAACICKPGYYVSSNNQTCQPLNIPLVGADDMNPTNCNNFKTADCIGIYGEQAFCKNEQCYCNRQSSFKNANDKCESFSNYIFPGEHELNLYSCNTETDCGGKEKVICDYLNKKSGYKVCKCQNGTLLDPKSQICVDNRCLNCNPAQNFECYNYQCRCKPGYYLSGSICIESTRKFELNQQCNQTVFAEAIPSPSLVCNPVCERVQCNDGYGLEGSNCAQYQLKKDKCVHRDDICKQIDEHAVCVKDENQCLCGALYYQADNICARAVGADCFNDDECGSEMICKGKRCTCNDRQHSEEISDIFGRPIQRCVNGIDQIRFHPVLFLFFVFIRLFFI